MDRLLLEHDPRRWVPLPGPQTKALASQADELFYGGAAGGGKTSLILGLAATCHQSSIIFRREFPQLKEIVDQSRKLIGKTGTYNGQEHIWRVDGGRVIEFGAVQHEWDVERYQGRPHDLIAFDELPNFLRSQYKFLTGWNRTADLSQRCRIVNTGNPPTTVEGRWVIEEWAPWLSKQHPAPAMPGELRWYTTVDDKLTWFDRGEPFTHKGERITPRSRTFIPARLKDNPILEATNYGATLQSLPEPLRSQLLYGDFLASMEDDPWQVIPTSWVEAAQRRWADTHPEPLSALGVDVARGGRDKTVIAPRRGKWFGKLQKYAGRLTPDGPTAAAVVVSAHEGQADINIDVIGIGASAYDSLKDHAGLAKLVHPINNAEASEERDRSNKYRLVNVRAASYWKLREALDPEHGDDLALPPDPELLADLCAPKWKVTASGIMVEPKADIVERLGRSPDCGDAVVLAHWAPRKRRAWAL